MASKENEDQGPDLTHGVSIADFPAGGMLRGHVGEDGVLLARVGDEVLAVGAHCTHYGAPLADGIVVGDSVRCPWHHACFSLRSGEATAAPAFDSLTCWRVERDGDRWVVRERMAPPAPSKSAGRPSAQPERVLIIGAGAAGFACAEKLRRLGYQGHLTLLSEEADSPCDRPNLSKDYLAGSAPEEWIPLRPDAFYAEHDIDLRLGCSARAIDILARTVTTSDGERFAYDRLLLATGAEPLRLPIPGAELPHVRTLRSLADSRAIIALATRARSALVLGSGFIGLETAAALRTRGLDVHVVSLDERPLEKVLGPGLGDFIREIHEQHGVSFHMQSSVASISPHTVMLDDGARIDADLVVLGVGVNPRTALAEAAGLPVDRGVLVDRFLQSAVRGIYAAGDVARWHDVHDNQTRRVEHWAVAERQGQIVAENMLGAQIAYREPPFFWSAHYDVTLRYLGHAPTWEAIEIEGSTAARDCLIRYVKDGKTIAVAAIGRDKALLEYVDKFAANP